MEILALIKEMSFNISKENFIETTKAIIKNFDNVHPISYNIIVSQIIYASYAKTINICNFGMFLNFVKEIESLEESNKINSNILKIFKDILVHKGTQESYYFLENLIEYNYINSKIIRKQKKSYFVHYMSKEDISKIQYNYFMKQILENFEDLSKNDWELHKKYIKEGHNPNEIAKIILNDEIEKLQEISSQGNFDFNQTIEPSLYERCSFINEENVSLIDYAAFFCSVKCFKYLLVNGANIKYTGKYAVAGGNEEIIHLCEQNHSSFEDAYETAIKFHRNDIFNYLYENEIGDIDYIEGLGKICILYHNYEIFIFLEEKGMKIDYNIINEAAKNGNIFPVKYFFKINQLPKDILIFSTKSGNIELVNYVLNQKGIYISFKNTLFKLLETALMLAAEDGYTEIVKLLLEQKGIDINAEDIFMFFFLIIILLFLDYIMIFGNYLNYFLLQL